MVDARPETTGELNYETYRATKHFSALDGLRAVSVLAVIWQHTAGFNDGRGLPARGYLGVDCFFVISGFLITTLLLRERAATGRISLRDFYLRRALRIFPIYYAVLAVYAVLVLAMTRHTRSGQEFLHNLPAFATYTSNWFVGRGDSVTFYFAWSLATEEQFYLFWPPLLILLLGWVFGRGRWASWAHLPLISLAGLLALDIAAHLNGWTVLASLAAPILLGAAAAVILHHPIGYRRSAEVFGAPWTAPVLAAVTLAAIQVELPDAFVFLLLAYLLVACVVREDTGLHRLLTWRPLVVLGTISYGVYLMHMLAANLVRPVLGHRFGVDVFAVTVPLVAGAAYLSYQWFERPIRLLARKRGR
ncbi:peptidoglycan/LPS O-acetylase OafA/YrhL [Kribbella amoyensis]|uniref:Peptidoglycan/LPS O-acetylase OafA/YrhL n=1 Tax=Kribbella amoyensis TaxID=996641 RepID=A0A561BU72_9ACTN|nr:acyltransferase [Kribbella amoyensis]TWD82407.1 peptidoglycan/LPS O-acetylase OafA/YrhL [Kribbella amoyensis]